MSLQRIHAKNCRSLETVSTPFTTTPIRGGRRESQGVAIDIDGRCYFNFTNCLKLDRNARKSIAAALKLKFKNFCSTISLQRLPKGETTANACYTGSEIPDWFSHKSTGSSITIKLSPPLPPPPGRRNSRRFLVFAVCAVAAFKVPLYWPGKFHYSGGSFLKNGPVIINCGFGDLYQFGDDGFENGAPFVDSNHVFLGYGLLLERWGKDCEGVDEISFEFHPPVAFQKQCEVKMFGIHFLYDEIEFWG